MKLFLSFRHAEVNGNFVTVKIDFKPAEAPEMMEVKNLAEIRSVMNDYIARNIKEGDKRLVVRKEGRAVPGFNTFYQSLPLAVNSATRL
ncbi:hypothetical protein BH012_10035 [Salmonella enterica]|nr:hypothetical protein [Salmonella enterica]EAX6601661.1 hypothetical protein [Salmonella enterica]